MLRGAQKQMIVVRTRNSRVFEEAYFVVRRGKTMPPVCKEDMLWEANRIIERSLAASPSPTREPESAGSGARIDGCGYRPASPGLCAGRAGYGVDSDPGTDVDDRSPFLSRRGLWRGLWFALGSLFGGGTVGLLWLLL